MKVLRFVVALLANILLAFGFLWRGIPVKPKCLGRHLPVAIPYCQDQTVPNIRTIILYD